MLDAATIKKLFKALNEELSKREVIGEVGICGGAVMCLVFRARKATKDVDAIFEPVKEIRAASRMVARKFGLEEGWLNDAVKGFLHVDPPREEVLNLPHLRVWAPSAEYMLAMKCISARFDTLDSDDTRFLISYLGLKRPEEVFKLIAKFYPHNKIPPKTEFWIEEIMEEIKQ